VDLPSIRLAEKVEAISGRPDLNAVLGSSGFELVQDPHGFHHSFLEIVVAA
jgi:hypothetical protein